jgi:DnaD/phage-associated family protein
MARARNIKPGFFINDALAEVEPLGRLLFIALWTIADRAGRLEDRPHRIKVQALPYDNCDPDALLNQLQAGGFILRYAVAGCPCIQITNFSKHQHPHMQEKASEIPPPPRQHAKPLPPAQQPAPVPPQAPNLHQTNKQQAPELYQTKSIAAPQQHQTDPSRSLELVPFTGSLNTTTGNPLQNSCSTPLQFHEQNFPGTISPVIAEKLVAWEEEVEPGLVGYALEKAVLAERRTYAYVDGILRNWRGVGIRTRKDAELAEASRQQQKSRARESPPPELPRAYMTRHEQIERGIINDNP